MASDVRLPQAKLWPRNDLWFWGVLAAAATLETPRFAPMYNLLVLEPVGSRFKIICLRSR